MSAHASNQRQPRARPALLQRDSLRDCSRGVLRQMWGGNALGTAAEIGYFLSLAIPPLLIMLVMFSAILEQHAGLPIVDTLEGFINERAPQETQAIFDTLIANAIGEISGGVASFGFVSALVISLWSVSNGISALIRATNYAFGVEETRPFARRRALAMGLATLSVIVLLLAIVLFFFGNLLGRFLADYFGFGTLFTILWTVGRWPLLVALMISMLAVLYYCGPNVAQTFRWVSPGSVIATGAWLLVAFGFWLFLQFWNPASLYGVAGFLMLVLAFMYATGFVFLLGAEINGVLAARDDPATAADDRRGPAAFPAGKEEPAAASADG